MTLIKVDHWNKIDLEVWKTAWPNFQPWELADRSNGVIIIPSTFMDQLQELRTNLTQPMHITSGCRTIEHNAAVDGKLGSFHICDADPTGRGQEGCLAVDVAATEGAYRGQLFALAWQAGWTVGWNAARGFLHLDRRVDVGWKQTSFDY